MKYWVTRFSWEAGKACDESCPCSPLRPVEQVGHISEGSIRLTVDGETKQDSDLRLMIWKVPEIIANLSKYFMLQPGDIILTKTLAGVEPVVPGNELVGSIQFGAMRGIIEMDYLFGRS